jgi:hypothetical protein
MTTAAVELGGPLQGLVDERLDAIDRLLLHAGVSRGERRGIVGEVEAQVYELIGRRTAGEPTRADVLSVLAALDPPESYAPEGYEVRPEAVGRSRRPAGPRPSALAIAGAAAGALDAVFVVAALGLLLLGGEEEALFALIPGALLAAAASVLGVWSVLRIRESRGMLFGLPAAGYAAIQLPLLMANLLAVGSVLLFEELALYLWLGMVLLVLNLGVPVLGWWLAAYGLPRGQPTSDVAD